MEFGLLPNTSFLKPKLPSQEYRDVRFDGTIEEQERKRQESTTLYVGNLSFYTTETQIFELFSQAGEVKRIIMGLDKFKKTPCGFCFVEYYTRADASNCVRFINASRLDGRIIRTDWDAGFTEGRQYGRGKSGGQVRDEYRSDYDPDRGGYGFLKRYELGLREGIQKDFSGMDIDTEQARNKKRPREADDTAPTESENTEANDENQPETTEKEPASPAQTESMGDEDEEQSSEQATGSSEVPSSVSEVQEDSELPVEDAAPQAKRAKVDDQNA